MKKVFLIFILFLVVLSLVYAQDNEKECVEDWRCEEWIECIDDLQARKCRDLSSCSTIENRPALIKDCDITEVQEVNVTKPVSGLKATGAAIINPIKNNWKISVGVVVVIIIIILIIYYATKPRNPEQFYRKAEKLNREAEESHAKGNSKRADKLNKKSEGYRRKARGGYQENGDR